MIQNPYCPGSDAHSFTELDERLGQVVSDSNGIVLEPTWIKADPTYEGLKQIIFEPHNRVFIGKEPEVERRVRDHKTKYIDTLHVTSRDGYQGQHGTWFADERIRLGKELVAIIGNKGSGKSAVTDIIGLLGNSHNQTSDNLKRNPDELFSFLNSEKFLKNGCAKNFLGTLIWYDGEPDSKSLEAHIARKLPEKVEYLPQKYLERICANIADDEFRSTLNEVIFRYVKDPQRYGQSNLDDLIAYLAQQANENIEGSKHDLHLANQTVVSVEKRLVADYQMEVEAKIRLKNEELAAHRSVRPTEILKPVSNDTKMGETADIEQLTRKIAEHNETIAQLENEQSEVSRFAEELRQVQQAIEREAGNLSGLKSQYDAILKSVGLSFDEVVKLEVDYSRLNALIAEKNERFSAIDDLLATEPDITERFADQEEADAAIEAAILRSIICDKARLEEQKTQLVERQTKPAREYQTYLTELATWTGRGKKIVGDDQNPVANSLQGLEEGAGKHQDRLPSRSAECENGAGADQQGRIPEEERPYALLRYD